MSALHLARTAYTSSAAPIRTQQSTEYDAFARITRRLNEARSGGPARFADLAAALHDNRRLWTVLAAEVADAANPLPQGLRAQIFYLAEFTLHHSKRVLAGQADAQALIEVNTAVMRGLRMQGTAQ